MNERILVPLDGSASAEIALPHALALAHLTKRHIELLRVVPPPVSYSQALWGAPIPASVWEAVEEEPKKAREYLANVAERCSALIEREQFGIVVHTQTLEGDPASSIIEYVEKHPWVTTIAMATHGRRGMDRWVFGSVAEKILQASPVPLLLVRCPVGDANRPILRFANPTSPSPDEVKYNTIVVPLDGSPFAEMALEQAKQVALATGAKLVLVSAIHDVPTVTGLLTSTEEQLFRDQEFEWRNSYLEDVKARLNSEGIKSTVVVAYRRPADAILDLSEDGHADLVVMSTHGRGGLRRLWLGSVANDVVRRSVTPVLLVRASESHLEDKTHDRATNESTYPTIREEEMVSHTR